jgi:hypothetical protein
MREKIYIPLANSFSCEKRKRRPLLDISGEKSRSACSGRAVWEHGWHTQNGITETVINKQVGNVYLEKLHVPFLRYCDVERRVECIRTGDLWVSLIFGTYVYPTTGLTNFFEDASSKCL